MPVELNAEVESTLKVVVELEVGREASLAVAIVGDALPLGDAERGTERVVRRHADLGTRDGAQPAFSEDVRDAIEGERMAHRAAALQCLCPSGHRLAPTLNSKMVDQYSGPSESTTCA